MASIYDEAISAIEKADVLVDQTGFSKSTISAWRTTTTALPAFAILSLLGHPIAGPIVMSRLGELAYVPPLTPEEQATREIKREAKRASIRLIEMLRAAIEENEK